MVACQTDYQVELQQTEKHIRELASALTDSEKRTRYFYRLYHRASLTGNSEHFRFAEQAIEAAIERLGPKEDLCLLQANFDFRFHRLARAKQDLEMAPALPSRIEAQALLADLDFQQGRYDDALLAYKHLIERNRTWDNLARLAYFKSKMGDIEGADRLYVEAEDELTAKEMRSFAWLELQRGLLDLSRGRHEEAAGHYDRAGRAYSGFWQVDEHKAEVLAAMGQFAEALALYLDLASRISKPELQQTIGELYAYIGRADEAPAWYERALTEYLRSAEQGDVHYYHHLADFYTDIQPDPADALKWARKDVELRSNYATQAALALALHQNGRVPEAVEYIEMALSSGVLDAHLFATAGLIYGSDEWRRKAFEMNPKYECFHVHH